MIAKPEACSACSLSHRERDGVKGLSLSLVQRPLTPTLSPPGRGGSPSSRLAPTTPGTGARCPSGSDREFLMIATPEACSACSLSHREWGGVRGLGFSSVRSPLTPPLSPAGRGSAPSRRPRHRPPPPGAALPAGDGQGVVK